MEETSDQEEYEVEAIVDQRKDKDGVTEYCVKWANTWQKADAFERGGQQILTEWQRSRGEEMEEDQEVAEGTATNTELRRQLQGIKAQVLNSLAVAEVQVVKAEKREVDLMKELEASKEQNKRLVQQMKDMNLFKLQQKDPEKDLRNKVEILEKQLLEVKTGHDDLERTLEKVADFLGVVLLESVTKDQIRQKLLKAEEELMGMNTKVEEAAEQVDGYETLLEEVADFLGKVLNENVTKSEIHDKLDQAKDVLAKMKRRK